ncbi:hypothetical protein SAMN05216503_2416 [Polaribacter sp. KT25b]|nr:hypothetical protein SAMN05216503_2416 [Polaribacter sp. KT25b]
MKIKPKKMKENKNHITLVVQYFVQQKEHELKK